MTCVALGSVVAPCRAAGRRVDVGGDVRAMAIRSNGRLAVGVAHETGGMGSARLVVGDGFGRGRGRDARGVGLRFTTAGDIAARRSRVVMRAADEDEAEKEKEKQRLAEEELARLRQLPLVDSDTGEQESVVGAEGVPQAIIEAERKSKPLRRWRLVTYALASSAAAAQVRNIPLNPFPPLEKRRRWVEVLTRETP